MYSGQIVMVYSVYSGQIVMVYSVYSGQIVMVYSVYSGQIVMVYSGQIVMPPRERQTYATQTGPGSLPDLPGPGNLYRPPPLSLSLVDTARHVIALHPVHATL